MSVLRGWDFSPKEMVHLYLQVVLVVGLLLICRSVAHKASTLLRLRTTEPGGPGFGIRVVLHRTQTLPSTVEPTTD